MNMLENKELRAVYADNLVKYGKKNKNIVVLEADLMNCHGTKKFLDAYPNRFINCGIAEANMIGVAAGLASCGKIPFAASFSPFATRRCYDQIAVSVGYTKMNVKIVGSDPGIMALNNGGTHMSLEDIALMCQVPEMVVVEPIDALSFDKLFPQIIACDKPMYIRMQRKTTPPVFEDNAKINLFKANVIKKGKDITIVAASIMVHRAVAAASVMKDFGIDAEIVAVHTYKPLDTETIFKSVRKTGACVSCENHHLVGGMGQMIATALLENDIRVPFGMVGVTDRYGEVGSEGYLAEIMGLTAQDIYDKVEEIHGKK